MSSRHGEVPGWLAAASLTLGAGASADVRFVDATEAAGIDFVHDGGRRGGYWLPEIIGGGVAILDFDGDGWMDIYLVQSGPQTAVSQPPSDRLYRNRGQPPLLFEDATAAAGIAATGYGMGVASADVDNDGDVDLLIANLGRNQLLRNNDGRFEEADAGLDDNAWSLGASFADFDRDGLLDLYVVNYVAASSSNSGPNPDRLRGRRPSACGSARQPSYCPPAHYPPAADRLYRNLGGGRFRDVTAALAAEAPRPGMGVIADDFDNDGWPDFFVANDGTANSLWLNEDGTFRNAAAAAGVAVNGDGAPEASMGVTAADFDGDGRPDLHVTHDRGETNTLYRNAGRANPRAGSVFEDATAAASLAACTRPYAGFGTGWFDADNDGDLDLFVANGAVSFGRGSTASASGFAQPDQLYLLGDDQRYRAAGLAGVSGSGVGRGAAFGDLDNDGDIDIVVANNHGPAQLLRNESTPAHWLGLDVRSRHGGPAIGAEVRLGGAGSPSGWRRVRTDGSYASAHDPRMVFGRGANAAPVAVAVIWPDGRQQRFAPLAVDRYHVLRQGASP